MGGVYMYLFYRFKLLWMNLITDGLPAMALGIDPPEKDVMERKAAKNKEPILSKRRLTMVAWQGLVLTLGALFAYFAGPFLFNKNPNVLNNPRIFQTIVFTTLVFAQLFHTYNHTYNYRFEKKGIFNKSIFENKYLNLAIIASIVLQIAITHVPSLQSIFSTASLNLHHWALILVSSITSVVLINFINEILYRKANLQSMKGIKRIKWKN